MSVAFNDNGIHTTIKMGNKRRSRFSAQLQSEMIVKGTSGQSLWTQGTQPCCGLLWCGDPNENVMDATFPMQTGAISYKIDLAVPAATGSWSVSLGYLDINPNVWNISGVSGKIYDNSGYVVGSYNPDTTTSLQGVIKGSGHTIYQDDVLLSNTETQDPSSIIIRFR